MSPTRCSSGMTLVEIMVSSALFSLILLGAYALISFSLKWNLKMAESVETYQQALRAYRKISTDLSTGSRDSFIYEVEGFAFASARPPAGPFQLDSSGQLLYHQYVVYYLDKKTLYRHTVPIAPPTATLPETPDLETLKVGLEGKGLIVAERISGLQIDPGSGATIKLRVDGENLRDENSFEIESRLTFRQ